MSALGAPSRLTLRNPGQAYRIDTAAGLVGGHEFGEGFFAEAVDLAVRFGAVIERTIVETMVGKRIRPSGFNAVTMAQLKIWRLGLDTAFWNRDRLIGVHLEIHDGGR